MAVERLHFSTTSSSMTANNHERTLFHHNTAQTLRRSNLQGTQYTTDPKSSEKEPCRSITASKLPPTMAATTAYNTTTISPFKRRRILMPAPPRATSTSSQSVRPKTSFYSLPAELRIAIYRLILQDVQIHILAPHYAAYTRRSFQIPHALVRTSHQIRNEVLPMIHAECPIMTVVEDLNFDGLLSWMSRMPPDQEANLCKNKRLKIVLDTSGHTEPDKPSSTIKNAPSLRKWLHIRADAHRPQPKWSYSTGMGTPDNKTACHLRRRAKRSGNPREQSELYLMLFALNISLPNHVRMEVNERLMSSNSSSAGQSPLVDSSDDIT